VILVDTSVWIDHLRRRDAELTELLAAGVVMCHPFVIGELATGALPQRERLLAELSHLPEAPLATQAEALGFLERHRLCGRGLGWVDVHLLASAFLAGRAPLLTRDTRLRALAGELGLTRHGGRH
jgi:predicted nucleic acid-binding protein